MHCRCRLGRWICNGPETEKDNATFEAQDAPGVNRQQDAGVTIKGAHRAALPNIVYGVDWVGCALVLNGVNSKRTTHSEGTAWPSTFAGAKSQRCAACNAWSAK